MKENEKIEAHAKMLKMRYLNKKYFFAKKGPIDEETQNIVSKRGNFISFLSCSSLIAVNTKLVRYWKKLEAGM